MSEETKLGCEYQGYEFGAGYLDSICIDGFLWDADSGEARPDGWLYDIGGEQPCPQCNHAEWLEYGQDQVENTGYEVAIKKESRVRND